MLSRYLLTTGMPRYQNYPTEMKQKITALPMGRSMAAQRFPHLGRSARAAAALAAPLMAKGVLTAQDAKLAADCGADAVIVSNHGGRVVDGTRAPIEILPEVVEAVGKRVEVIVDSGFRRGTDIVKALALGARAVLIGRATLYGTAAGGEAGAARAISAPARGDRSHARRCSAAATSTSLTTGLSRVPDIVEREQAWPKASNRYAAS